MPKSMSVSIKKGRKLKERCLKLNEDTFCFTPATSPNAEQSVTIFCDELETIRLKHLEQLDITTGGQKMKISKSTFARIYDTAMTKISDALVHGKSIHIAKRCYLNTEE